MLEYSCDKPSIAIIIFGLSDQINRSITTDIITEITVLTIPTSLGMCWIKVGNHAASTIITKAIIEVALSNEEYFLITKTPKNSNQGRHCAAQTVFGEPGLYTCSVPIIKSTNFGTRRMNRSCDARRSPANEIMPSSPEIDRIIGNMINNAEPAKIKCNIISIPMISITQTLGSRKLANARCK